jgi:hypothetical protein
MTLYSGYKKLKVETIQTPIYIHPKPNLVIIGHYH